MSARAPLRLRPSLHVPPVTTAMLLAAGLGTRMRPLTASCPKPLVPVAGKPLLDHALDRLATGGVERVVVNVHYLPEQVEAHVAARDGGPDIAVSDERALLLETGGGVARALPLLAADRFLVVNSDNLWVDGPVDAVRLLADRWDDASMDALLLLVPLARAACHAGQGDFHMDGLGRLVRRRRPRLAPYVFTGVQLVHRRLFAEVPEGPFSMNLLFDRAIAAGRLYGLVHQGLWFDVGTPAAIPVVEAAIGQL